MRWDRTLSLYLVRPLMQTGFVSAKRTVPILMYHSISDAAEPGVSPYYKTGTSPARFEQQMRWLTEAGFRSVDLEEGLRLAQRGIEEKEKIAVITFDDGFRDFYDLAFPVLKKYGHTATMFPPTAFLGDSRQSFKNKECLTWQEVHELRAGGIRFGSHTVTHPVLYENSWPDIENELAASKENLEQALGEKITSFAYPYAFPQHDRPFVEKFQESLRQSGYRSCVTTVIGRVQTGDDPFRLKRLPVNDDDDRTLLLAKLNGAYDWLAYPQIWAKAVRHQLRPDSKNDFRSRPVQQGFFKIGFDKGFFVVNPPRYIIITPVRNEEEYLQDTVASVVSQTIHPVEWIIVNDGSTDRTREIIEAAVAEHSWIRPVHRADRGFRKSGGGVMEAFHDGLQKAGTRDWGFLVKLDGDLTFAPDYFEKCFAHFSFNPRLGIGGGLVCNEMDGRRILDSKDDPEFHVRGATKIYRRACWDAIGGLIRTVGWDTMDELKANMLSWKTYTFPEITLIHHRQTGGADGAWRNYFKNGRANYIVGYHPFFMLGKCARRLLRRPYGIASLALWCGFITGYTSRAPQVVDRAVIRYLRSEQWRALMGKKCLWKAYQQENA